MWVEDVLCRYASKFEQLQVLPVVRAHWRLGQSMSASRSCTYVFSNVFELTRLMLCVDLRLIHPCPFSEVDASEGCVAVPSSFPVAKGGCSDDGPVKTMERCRLLWGPCESAPRPRLEGRGPLYPGVARV